MVKLGQLATALAIGFVLLISLLNPGGFFAALFIAFIILALYALATAGAPFIADYVVSINKGKKAAGRKSIEDSHSGKGGRR